WLNWSISCSTRLISIYCNSDRLWNFKYMRNFLFCLFCFAAIAAGAQTPALTVVSNKPAARHDTSKRLSPDEDDEEEEGSVQRVGGMRTGRGVLGHWPFDTTGATEKAAAVEQTWKG